MMISYDDDDDEQEPLVIPDICEQLGNRNIDYVLLNSNEFCKVLRIIDYRDDEVKTYILKEFGINDHDYFNVRTLD